MEGTLTRIIEWRPPKSAMFVLRWIVLLPVAFIGALVGALFIRYANEGGILLGILVNYLFGLINVCLGAYVAPSYKRQVAMVIAGGIVLVGGVLLLPAFQRGDYWAVLELLGTIGGAVGGYYFLSAEFTKS